MFRGARIVAFSTGNVYPLSSAPGRGPGEEAPTGPIGEYAQSCVGRERLFDFFSRRHGTRVTLLRLNYAVELRYGVLVDLAAKIMAGTPIDLPGRGGESLAGEGQHAQAVRWFLTAAYLNPASVWGQRAQLGAVQGLVATGDRATADAIYRRMEASSATDPELLARAHAALEAGNR